MFLYKYVQNPISHKGKILQKKIAKAERADSTWRVAIQRDTLGRLDGCVPPAPSSRRPGGYGKAAGL
jgi:hypothetical protein